jgi:hypothetical protein
LGLEKGTGPLYGVFDLIGEVFQGAKRDAFLALVLTLGVALGQFGQDHLRIALSSQCAALKQCLLIKHASRITIHPSLNIINGINNEIESVPEGIVEKFFVFRTITQFIAFCH